MIMTMAKKLATVDYSKCNPERCDKGICLAVLECEYGSLIQQGPYDMPEVNPAKWCHGCAKCAKACPSEAIRML